MSATLDYSGLKEKLVQERVELTRAIRRMEKLIQELGVDQGEGSSGISNHLAEGASSTFAQERNLALAENLARTLEQVEAALKRMDVGTYGLCRVCNGAIDRARLRALPYAAQCLHCQTRLEER